MRNRIVIALVGLVMIGWLVSSRVLAAPADVAAPSNLYAFPVTASGFTVQWTDNAENESSYVLFIGVRVPDPEEGTAIQWFDPIRLPAGTTSWDSASGPYPPEWTGVQAGRTYVVKVAVIGPQDVNGVSNSEFAATIEFTTPGGGTCRVFAPVVRRN